MTRFYPLLLLIAALTNATVAFAQATPAGSRNAPATNQPSKPAAQSDGRTPDGPDPLLDVPPMPTTTVTLVGGVVTHVDRIRNKLAVQPFGSGSSMKMTFDERTHIYRDGRETTQLGVKKGDRVYVDTQLDSNRVFARNIRVESSVGPADASGQVVSFDPADGVLTMRDSLSSAPVNFRVDQHTTLKLQGNSGSTRDLVPGALVNFRFAPQNDAAQEVAIIAVPGSIFSFSGKVTHLDMSTGLLSVENATDNKPYDLHFDHDTPGVSRQLTEGADVSVQVVFNGTGYRVTSVTVNQAARNE